MSTRELLASAEALRSLFDDVQATVGDSALPGLDGRQVHELFAQTIRLTASLRKYLATDDDPRLALEMATAAHALSAEATRLQLVAAERVNATAAHTLAQEELEALRKHPADTSTLAQRATGRPSYKNAAELLASWTRTPHKATSRLVNDALDLVARRDMAGFRVPPRFPQLSERFFDPKHNPEAVREISQKLARVEPPDTTFDGIISEPTLRHTDGRTLQEHAAESLDQEFTASAAAKKVEALIAAAAHDPQRATAASLRRGMFKLPPKNPHLCEYLLRTTTLEGALIDSHCARSNSPRTQAGQLARVNPASAHPPSPAGSPQLNTRQDVPDFLPEGAETARWSEGDFQPAEASPPERALNAFLNLLEFEAIEPTAPPTNIAPSSEDDTEPLFDLDDPGAEEVLDEELSQSEDSVELTASDDPHNSSEQQRPRKRIRPLVIAHLYMQDLQNSASWYAETQHGVNLPAEALRQLLCKADILPAVFNSDGALLDFGRRRRLVPDILQKAVLARDRYCIVPGCTRSVEHLDFHHVIPFSQGGRTNLNNIVPACRSHHMELDLGLIHVRWCQDLPWVLLPPDRDPDQRLRRNYVPPGVPISLAAADTG
ncbi:HNH endonuclease signature motif containing protein [Glutamicibacter uratoxydans]|uniref:HNH endonuclease signature motif containing protein n=1 Tax=Glutamicibacter uratoxydans TaxID=43667 RepID=UPI003D6F8B5D